MRWSVCCGFGTFVVYSSSQAQAGHRMSESSAQGWGEETSRKQKIKDVLLGMDSELQTGPDFQYKQVCF